MTCQTGAIAGTGVLRAKNAAASHGDYSSRRVRRLSHRPLFFHIDPFWADSDIDFVGIDLYVPMSDGRDTPLLMRSPAREPERGHSRQPIGETGRSKGRSKGCDAGEKIKGRRFTRCASPLMWAE